MKHQLLSDELRSTAELLESGEGFGSWVERLCVGKLASMRFSSLISRKLKRTELVFECSIVKCEISREQHNCLSCDKQ